MMQPPLKNVHIFTGLSDRALKQISESGEQLDLPTGAVVVKEGEIGHCMFVIAEGEVRICKHHGLPDQVELAELGPGEFFGEMSILDTLARCATACAVTPVKIFSVGCDALYHLYKTMPDQYGILMLNIARDLTRRLRRMDEVFAARH